MRHSSTTDPSLIVLADEEDLVFLASFALIKFVNQSFVKVFDHLKEIQNDLITLGFVFEEGPSSTKGGKVPRKENPIIIEEVEEKEKDAFIGDKQASPKPIFE
ncbi:hypothetical protein L2E82_16206 [Cichorium intybus]|uniref:Uncharacterized protein n=1 Tax=Cichorium intybus TaxID=13427 RepID=A0ACB9F4W9_CICIN|nr:hypothetical protein L2E82_16206 [Cichorium intybus]